VKGVEKSQKGGNPDEGSNSLTYW